MSDNRPPSLAARLVNRYLRLTMKRLPLHQMAPDELRYWFENRRLPFIPKGVDVELVESGKVVGEWQRPRAGGAGVLLYIHGGGYIFGSPRVYRTLTFRLALAAGVNVFALRYRLAPESLCPAPIEDALAAYEHLLKSGFRPDEIVLGGDSAGGGLALATLQALLAKGAPQPAGAVLYSPWTDLSASGASVARNAESDCMFREETVRAGGRRYAGTLDLKDPRVSPLFGDFRGMAPLLVFASSSEMLHDDSVRLVERARAQGASVRFEESAGLAHVWPLLAALMPEGREAIATTAGFIRERIKAPASQRKAA
ncbi:MAG: alpha/beta hydrolase [Parvularculaceae bacterium]|jgi:acetyl esterase/lipase|nr:alpha/beta hydrolase [Parvularculaceae bacterium]